MNGALLGPQQTRTTLGAALAALEQPGPVAIVTAGWQEREDQDADLASQLGRDTINLRLYQRGEDLLRADPEFAKAHRARQDSLRQIQEYYRFRLDRVFDAALDIDRKTAGTEFQADELRVSMQQIRRLDAEHLERAASLGAAFDQRFKPFERDEIAQHRETLRKTLAHVKVVAIAGGHVAVLLNRMRMFGLAELIRDHTLLAWSAGAMATSERIVLFHESPPQGKGISEVLELGLGLHQGVLPLPNPKLRLKLDDPFRVRWFAERYAPATCVAFDQGDWVRFEGTRWFAADGTLELMSDGTTRAEWTS